MPSAPRDVAQIRLDNAMRLFEEFVSATVKHPDAATLRGLERRFAEKLQIQPSYWSQIKGRSRQIGERLARQFEQLCHKPPGWMDIEHGQAAAAALGVATSTIHCSRGLRGGGGHDGGGDRHSGGGGDGGEEGRGLDDVKKLQMLGWCYTEAMHKETN